MYLHVGNGIAVNSEEIVGIFDMENTTVSRQGRGFLVQAEKNGTIVDAAEDIPVSYVVCVGEDNALTVYFSSISTKTLLKRASKKNLIEEIYKL